MKKRIIVCTIAVLVFVALLLLSLVYDHQNNGNCVTTISGLWSAVATLAVGLIAYWQNKKYKKISDDTTDAMLMPDLYHSTSFSDEFAAPFEKFRALVKGRLDLKEEYKYTSTICLNFVKGPILNLTVKEIRNETEVLKCIPGDAISLRDEAIPFKLELEVPREWPIDMIPLSVILTYENVYGTKYEKTIHLSRGKNYMALDAISFEKAKRIVSSIDDV